MVVLNLTNYKGSDTLNINGVINQNEYIKSQNGLYILHVHTDGIMRAFPTPANNATSVRDPSVFWYAGFSTSNTGLKHFDMQSDGNIVLKVDGAHKPVLWTANTKNKGGIRFVLQNDRNIILYNSAGSKVWESGTSVPTNENMTYGKAIKCISKDQNTVFRWLGDDLLGGYPNQNVAQSWDPNWSKFVNSPCTDSQFNNRIVMSLKPNDKATIKCSDDKNIYRYSNSENKLYKFPDQMTINQYAGAIPGEVDCRQYSGRLIFTDYDSIPSNTPNGQAIRCSTDLNSIYRYLNGNIYKYESDSVADQWDPTWRTTYKIYNCGTKTSSGIIKNKAVDRETVKCGNIYYRYSQAENKLLSYENASVAIQYGGTLPTTDTLCDVYNKGTFTAFSEFSAQENVNGQTIKCSNKDNIYYRWTNGKLYPYTNTTASTWDPNYATSYKKYNCNNPNIISDKTMISKPGNNDIIRCNNRNDKKTYNKSNGNTIQINVDSSNNHFKLNTTTKKYERYGNEEVLKSYEQNYSTLAKSVDDCNMLDNSNEDSVILYPEPPDKKIIKCTNQSGFPYYLYENQKLRKFPVPNVAERYDQSYLSIAENYNCSYINTTLGTQMNYSNPPGGSVINCSNESSSTYPKYYFNSETNKLNKYPNKDIYMSWDLPDNGSNYDCNYLLIPKDGIKGYKKPPNNTNLNCSNKTDSSFPYYRYDSSNNSLSQYKDITALFTYSPWNADITTNKTMNMSTYDCNYLSNTFGSIIDNKPLSDNTNITCSNETSTPSQLYRYSSSVIRPFTPDKITEWNVKPENVANCTTFIKGPPMYDKSFEDAFSFTLNPFLEINRNDTITYFLLDNTNNKCNPMPQNYTVIDNQNEYDKYYSIDKFAELYKDSSCNIKASNDSNIKYDTQNGFNVGKLTKSDNQDSLYYKLTTNKR